MSGGKSLFAIGRIERTFPIDEEIERLLSHNTPMALLRDLHRPVNTFDVNPMDFVREERVSDGGRGFVAEVKETLFMRYWVDMRALSHVPEIFRSEVKARREILSSRWVDAPKFGKQYLPAMMTGGWM